MTTRCQIGAPAARPVPTGRYPEQASAARALLREESK